MKKAVCIVILIVIMFGMAGILAYGGYSNGTGSVSDAEEETVSGMSGVLDGLEIQTEDIGDGSRQPVRYAGEIVPQATLKVKLESDRKVGECYVKEGDRVKEGQKLFCYDTEEDENKIAEDEIEIEKEEDSLETAAKSIELLEAEKAKAGAEEQLSYSINILKEQNSIRQSEFTIKSKTREVEQLKAKIADSEVTAEMEGIVQKINDPDNPDSPADGKDGSVYMTILADGNFRVKCKTTEEGIKQVGEGMPLVAHSRVDSTKTWNGTVSEIVTDNTEENNSDDTSDNTENSKQKYFYVELENTEGLIIGQHVYLE